ncbi:GAF domain-containing protein [Turneriella parva]|uniref:histidine kinase n=1 Tax=Turneriella parva (strain ATCC BAA-1111 / DSM 21527 / NCTC 11395 / H) TaxID=869212 RepID=I4B3C2_TURPD|nr:GAF domain-containing protein [Turneriella parva]AFM11779.1 CheA signal transduction histidine kinase [Turneriella parva DSM 21527]
MAQSSELNFSDLVQNLGDRRYVRAADVKGLVHRLNKLTLIMQVSRSLMGAMELKKLLGEILSKARIVMSADKASIFMIDEARNEIYASVTLDGNEIRLPRGAGIIGFVADSGETVNITDAYSDARFNRDNDLKTGYRTRSILCMPVHNQDGKIIGAIQVLNKLDEHSFTHEDEELLSAFTAMVGVCLENARAYAELAAERNSLEERVIERTAELALAKAETDQILRAVEEGLFLLYRSGDRFIIGGSHSEALGVILEQTELRSKNFLEILSQFFDSATIDKTKLFLELMFEPQRKQNVLLGLNPLSQIKGLFSGGEKQKFLRFRFGRVMNDANNRVDHLLVTVSDISHEIALQQKLERTEAQNRRHIEMLLAILQSEPATLSEFLADLRQDLLEVSQTLERHAAGAVPDRRAMLLDIYRIVHSIKGNSSLLNFQALTELAHQTESIIESVLNKDEILAGHVVSLAAPVSELENLANELRAWLEKIEVFQKAFGQQKSADLTVRSVAAALEKAAASQHKKALLVFDGFRSGLIAPQLRKNVKDMLVQLVRNSAVHGIEAPETRLAAGKPEVGRVQLISHQQDGKIFVIIEDDGRGIHTERLGERLIETGRLTSAQFESMDADQRLMLIFESEVSTHEGVSELAGRGIGMSIVAESCRQMGATIEVESEPGKFTRFVIEFRAGDNTLLPPN